MSDEKDQALDKPPKPPVPANEEQDTQNVIRKVLRDPKAFFSMLYSYSGPAPNPIAEKMTPDNITELIELKKSEMYREYNDRSGSRQVFFWSLFIILIAFVSIAITLVVTDNVVILGPLLDKIVIGVSGVLGGGGSVAMYLSRQRREG